VYRKERLLSSGCAPPLAYPENKEVFKLICLLAQTREEKIFKTENFLKK
jgi:hypothetical protein